MPSSLTAHAVHSAAPRGGRYKLHDAHALQRRVKLAQALTQSSSLDAIADEGLAKMEREQRAEATLTKTR